MPRKSNAVCSTVMLVSVFVSQICSALALASSIVRVDGGALS